MKGKAHLKYPNYAGALATGGGLVFIALLDGTVAAFDDTTMQELWKINVGAGFYAPPMTFEIDGKQYVVIAAGASPSSRGSLVTRRSCGTSARPRCCTCSGCKRGSPGGEGEVGRHCLRPSEARAAIQLSARSYAERWVPDRPSGRPE